MLQSKLFTRTRKEAPTDEVSKNAQLLIRAGFIHKEMAGVYSYLPMGLKVLNNICNIIREEMNEIGGQELIMTALQDKALWEKTNRWSDEVVDNWFKTTLKNDTQLGLGFTHEEELTNLMKDYISSFRDLPVYAYQIQTKFRNEARAKSGIMRGREILMKDLYSFSRDEEEHKAFYEKCKMAYQEIFKRVGIGDKTYVTYASGGVFSKYSDEFQTVTESGEDTIYICKKCKLAVNKEIKNESPVCVKCGQSDFEEKKAVEVGNIFTLGTRFSEAFNLKYRDKNGQDQLVFMGSYGIGPGRLMGTIVEVLSDEKGIVWPREVSPFLVHLIEMKSDKKVVKNTTQKIYQDLIKNGVQVLYDDREDKSAGEKFADSDLIGIPFRVVVSEKTLAKGSVELKDRKGGEVKLIKIKQLTKAIK